MKGIEFKGKALEYFGIWLANILLTVVTIGIFSAWAKVRRLKYFYNNTNILENSFAYHWWKYQKALPGETVFHPNLPCSNNNGYFRLPLHEFMDG